MSTCEPSDEFKKKIKKVALKLGFGECRFTSSGIAPHKNQFYNWLDKNYNGEMHWMARDPNRRSDINEVFPQAKSIIVLATNYYNENKRINKSNKDHKFGEIAKYAWGEDYHDIILKKLKIIDQLLIKNHGTQKCYVDTGPILERDFATKAGVGWNGKSTVQIHRKLGTWFFLSVIITDLDFKPDKTLGDGCGNCVKCIDICPTNAILSPHVLDSRKCISYLTIENKNSIPIEYREAIGDKIYGCDDCLTVCPWNKFAQKTKESKFAIKNYLNISLQDFLKLNDEEFRQIFKKSPIKRIKLPSFLRNVCVALGNVGNKNDINILKKVRTEHNLLVREHADWAIKKILSRNTNN